MPTAMSSLPVVVVDDDAGFRARVEDLLGGRPVFSSRSIADLEHAVDPGTAAVVVFGPSFANGSGLRDVGAVTARRPELGAVIMVERLGTKLLRAALRAGVRDVLALPVEEAELGSAVERVAGTLSPPPAGRTGGPRRNGRLITVFSTKGGAGTTVTASNLAVTLARRGDAPVALVDADLQFGDIGVMLKLAPQHTVIDVVAAIDRLDAEELESLLVRHPPSGLLVLPAPVEPSYADQVSAADMVKITEALRTFCTSVVVDTPSAFNDVVLGLLDHSDEIVLVTALEIPSIKNAKLALQTFRLLGIPLTKVRLVVNRSDSKATLDLGEVERALQMRADVLVPSDVAVPQSVNKGVPVVLDAPKSGVARSVERLADLLVAQPDKRTTR